MRSRAFLSTSCALREEAASAAANAGSSLANVIDTSITVGVRCGMG